MSSYGNYPPSCSTGLLQTSVTGARSSMFPSTSISGLLFQDTAFLCNLFPDKHHNFVKLLPEWLSWFCHLSIKPPDWLRRSYTNFFKLLESSSTLELNLLFTLVHSIYCSIKKAPTVIYISPHIHFLLTYLPSRACYTPSLREGGGVNHTPPLWPSTHLP